MARTFNRGIESKRRPASQIQNKQTEEPLEELFGRQPKALFTVGFLPNVGIRIERVRDEVLKIIKSCKTKNVSAEYGNAPGHLFAHKTEYYIEFICTEDERKKIQSLVNNMSLPTLRSFKSLPLTDQAVKDEVKKMIVWGRGRYIKQAIEDDSLQQAGQGQNETPAQLEEAIDNWYKQEW